MTKELAADVELDALVAARVMGWTVMARPQNGRQAWGNDPSGFYTGIPHYSSSVAADYEVLVRVREQWPLYLTTHFARVCEATWEGRGVSGFGAWLVYQPGDYSRAALAALDATPAPTTPTGRGRAEA